MLNEINIIKHNGKQYISDLTTAKVAAPFRGKPTITNAKIDEDALVNLCPTKAILKTPLAINLAKCTFCGECAFQFPAKIQFTTNHHLASNDLHQLIVKEGDASDITFNPNKVRKEIQRTFKKSLKLRQVCAGGDGSCEAELGACGNPNFDVGRYGISFTASPRHADGLVITGPITENMADAIQIAYDALPSPKLVILCGVDALSGGIFAESKALNRKILEKIPIDLYLPGNPPHPLTIIDGILKLIGRI